MINQTSMVGRLVDDPTHKYSNNGGKSVANFKLAVQRPYKDQGGNKPTDFIPCVVWGPQADFIADKAKKGKLVAVSGRMQSRDYDHSQYPIKVYVIELNCDEVQLVEWDDNGQQGGNNQGYSNQQRGNNNRNQNYNNNNQGNYGNNNQGYSNNQGYNNNQGYGNQGYSNQGYNNQNYNNNQSPRDQGRTMQDPFAQGQSIDIKDDDLPF